MFFLGCPQHFESLLERSGDSGLSRREIHRGLVPPASARQVRRTLEELQKKGLAKITKPGPAARWNIPAIT